MSRKAKYLAREVRNATTFDNTFQKLGTGSGSPAVLVKIINDSDTYIDISLNGGTTQHDFIPAESFFLYDMRANHGREFDFVFPKDTQWHVRGAAAGIGKVYLVVIAEVT